MTGEIANMWLDYLKTVTRVDVADRGSSQSSEDGTHAESQDTDPRAAEYRYSVP
jgi:hypothetical protein